MTPLRPSCQQVERRQETDRKEADSPGSWYGDGVKHKARRRARERTVDKKPLALQHLEEGMAQPRSAERLPESSLLEAPRANGARDYDREGEVRESADQLQLPLQQHQGPR